MPAALSAEVSLYPSILLILKPGKLWSVNTVGGGFVPATGVGVTGTGVTLGVGTTTLGLGVGVTAELLALLELEEVVVGELETELEDLEIFKLARELEFEVLLVLFIVFLFVLAPKKYIPAMAISTTRVPAMA